MHRSAEEQAIASGRGKWSDAGVPHEGWNCVEIEDLGAPLAKCDMCEAQLIRFVHYMEHPEYGETLACGCVCAGHMEQDLAAARGRDETMRSRAGKRMRWLTRSWKISAKGNDWLQADGFRITIFKRNGGWAAAVVAVDRPLKYFSRRSYPSGDQAKLAAFDLLTQEVQAQRVRGT
jgi:hypothetical protein